VFVLKVVLLERAWICSSSTKGVYHMHVVLICSTGTKLYCTWYKIIVRSDSWFAPWELKHYLTRQNLFSCSLRFISWCHFLNPKNLILVIVVCWHDYKNYFTLLFTLLPLVYPMDTRNGVPREYLFVSYPHIMHTIKVNILFDRLEHKI
jgi:hypothetical protein